MLTAHYKLMSLRSEFILGFPIYIELVLQYVRVDLASWLNQMLLFAIKSINMSKCRHDKAVLLK